VNHPRRLARLEAVTPPAALSIDGRQRRAWLATLPDADIDVLADVAEHVKAGGTVDDKGAATCDVMARIQAAWDAWREGATP
jgi:hypothetical protein